ncbi:MAG: hypothetical protein ACI8RZ_003611, partial [Myxococcota bacterium]
PLWSNRCGAIPVRWIQGVDAVEQRLRWAKKGTRHVAPFWRTVCMRGCQRVAGGLGVKPPSQTKAHRSSRILSGSMTGAQRSPLVSLVTFDGDRVMDHPSKHDHVRHPTHPHQLPIPLHSISAALRQHSPDRSSDIPPWRPTRSGHHRQGRSQAGHEPVVKQHISAEYSIKKVLPSDSSLVASKRPLALLALPSLILSGYSIWNDEGGVGSSAR